MTAPAPQRPEFSVTHERQVEEVVVAGFSEFGLAGLTAVDYLADHLGLEESGYVRADALPSLVPFENGRPRHHTRILSAPDAEVSVLVSELLVPPRAARPFGDALLDWTETAAVEELAVLSGVPIPHGPEAHRTFAVATDDYRERRPLDDAASMPSGVLDGVNAALIERGMESSLSVGLFATPVHAQAPDVDAAIRLLETVVDLYDLDVDVEPLEAFAEEVRDHYAALSERLDARDDRELPDDRMYM